MSTIQIQSGVANVGNNSGNALKRFTVSFPEPFTEVPVFVGNTLQGTDYPGNINDTFAISVKTVSTTQAVVQVYRTDFLNGWSQNLQLGWIAISS